MRRIVLLMACVLAACGEQGAEGPGAEPPERALAARHACVAEQLARTAVEDLETLESGFAGMESGAALATFARAFAQHAQLRNAAYAQMDSALNRSATAADSARHAERASRMSINPPAPGSVEANVIADYDRRAAAILADQDHPCNWQHELEAR